MRTVGLKFLLEGSMFIVVPEFEGRAIETINNFLSGHYRLRDVTTIGRTNDLPEGGIPWSIRVDRIVAIHLVEPEQLAPQQPVPAPPPPYVTQTPPSAYGARVPFPAMSGRN